MSGTCDCVCHRYSWMPDTCRTCRDNCHCGCHDDPLLNQCHKCYHNHPRCGICDVEEPTDLTRHHLLPREFNPDERRIVYLCRGCHDLVHKHWSNERLRDDYNTLEKILRSRTFRAHLRNEGVETPILERQPIEVPV